MDPLILARLQFAATCVYHFFFVPLTLGLSVIVAIMQTIYVASDKEVYKRMTKFWGKLFLINFAMGVVTGIVMEFQFGMNWSEYSRFVGDIFGAPLAIEALLAFFLESTFLGVWIFGWDKLPKKIHLAAIWLAGIGANVSAFWILIANSFMQHPVGYVVNAEAGRAEMVDFFALLKNPNLWDQFPHTVMGGFATGAFFIIGVSAYHLVKKNQEDFFRRSIHIAAIVGIIAVLVIGYTGHGQAQGLAEIQPMKLAAAEQLWDTEDPASFSLITLGDLDIRIPGVLSFMVYNKFDGQVQGINDLQVSYEEEYGPGNYIPPVVLSYWSFRIMVGAGTAMILLAVFALYKVVIKKGTLEGWVGKVFILSIALPYMANTFGWILTEVGRLPWTVYGLLKLEDAVSPHVTSGQLLMSLIGFVLLYGALMVADIYLLRKFAVAGPGKEE